MYLMTEHIKEAIELNKKRMPLYAALTNKKSLRFSRKLIAIEYLSLITAKFIDLKAGYFNKHKVKIVAADFISMNNVPSFEQKFKEGVCFEQKFRKVDLISNRKLLYRLIAHNEFNEVVNISEQFLFKIADQRHHYGMTRHLFESIGRIAYLAPLHQEQCEKKGIKSSIQLSKKLLYLHWLVLQEAYKFDEEVAFIQNEGIPFIIQDMPRIELENPY